MADALIPAKVTLAEGSQFPAGDAGDGTGEVDVSDAGHEPVFRRCLNRAFRELKPAEQPEQRCGQPPGGAETTAAAAGGGVSSSLTRNVLALELSVQLRSKQWKYLLNGRSNRSRSQTRGTRSGTNVRGVRWAMPGRLVP